MKKALIVLLALCFVGAVAFAEGETPTVKYAVNTWYGFGVYSPSSGNDLIAFDYDWNGTSATRVKFFYTAADGTYGFNSRAEFSELTGASWLVQPLPVVLNRLNGWAKLFNGMLTIRAGILDDYTIATTDWFLFGTTNKKTGMYFNLTPISGLDIGFFQVIPDAPVGLSANGDMVGFAFAMPNLLSVQAGVQLDFTNTVSTGHQIWFGANVSAVPNLTAILEGRVKLLNGSTPILLEQNLGYTMGPLTVGARIGEYSDNGLDWGVEPTVAYKLNDNVTLNAIVNVYDFGVSATGSAGNVTYMSPVDAGVMAAGDVNTINFGGGVSVFWIMGGARVTVGDYYGAQKNAGNLFYVNLDVTL